MGTRLADDGCQAGAIDRDGVMGVSARFHPVECCTGAADRVIFPGEAYLRRVNNKYMVYCHPERSHQDLDGAFRTNSGSIGDGGHR